MFYEGFADELLKLANGDMLAYFRDHPKKLREKIERDRKKKLKKKASKEKLTAQERFAISRGAKMPEEKKEKKKGLIRKAGPGVGALAGLGAALALKKPVIGGIGTGATLGWLPDIAASLKEAIKGE